MRAVTVAEFVVGGSPGRFGGPLRTGPDVALLGISPRGVALALIELAKRIGRSKLREVTVGFADIATTVASRLKITEQELKRTITEFNKRYPELGLSGLEEGLAGTAPGEVDLLPMWKADP